MEYYRRNGVARRRLQAYATVATGALRVQVRACYGHGHRPATGMDTGIQAGIDVKFL